MKAYMSDPTRPYDRIQNTKEKPTMAAINEAKRILDDTEPERIFTYLGPLLESSHLAEALAAFVAD